MDIGIGLPNAVRGVDRAGIVDWARRALDPGVTWFGWHVPGLLEAGVVALLGLVMLAIAILQFSRAE